MPRIVTARAQGLAFQNLFGELGPERHVTGHHTAGPKDTSDAHCAQLIRSYHNGHAAKGWGGLGYHFAISRSGTIFCGRPLILKGAHVGGHNSNNVGVMFHGTTGDTPTQAQAKAFRWLLLNGHTWRMPKAHRSDRKLNKPSCDRKGHKDWDGHRSNACPGTHHKMILAGGSA
ncbi:MAG: peptidoglycan recognition protein family protein [Chloroflexi bacterium]|nr:peptidoglycan recognition protein family protein [Chloroflexota bacterium]